MGNKLVRRRQVVDEKYTRPQGLYHHKDVDIKKLRKLILESKLAPCYPGDEDGACELEECPICFLYYPSLNRSRCCTKGICTECFLQMKVPNSNGPTQCPFCKTLNYAVEYRGVKTKEEKGIEQVEEQRVIEAKIRIRQKELQDEEERMLKRQDLSSSSRNLASGETENSAGAPSRRSHLEGEDVVSDGSCATSVPRHPPMPRTNREDEFDLDLEDIMVMEAIWLSIQENGKQKALGYEGEVVGPSSEHYVSEDHYVSEQNTPTVSCSAASPSGGLACAIAALAERQQITTGESSSSCSNSNSNPNSMPNCNQFYSSNRMEQEPEHYQSGSGSTENEEEWCMESRMANRRRTRNYHRSGRGSPENEDDDEVEDEEESSHHQNVPEAAAAAGGAIVPESFEEQMMLAMAVSLAEARVPPGVTWH